MEDSNVFSLRIVCIDHYMAPPITGLDIAYSSFHGEKVNEVPVIRVYGSTPAGQKTCLHVHRAWKFRICKAIAVVPQIVSLCLYDATKDSFAWVLPYLYVPCADIPLQPHQEGDTYTHDIALAMEKALKLKSNLKRQHVHGCSLVRARKFYGYHSSEELFAKIYFYYPHDVSRAANLLLGGAVLDKCLQPHESHIPFILQFLIDYNLYGMGHIHLSKMKFRHPVPDVFTQRKSFYNGHPRKDMDLLKCTLANFQADLSSCSSVVLPVWISSTIPADWMWHSPSECDASSNSDVKCIKRESVCQLEGDATVDEILNQQFKMYTSLSQTHSDVKMVQSLVPIWEEENERSGMHEVAILSDPSKPLPGDVLKTFSLGLEFKNKLLELQSEAENSMYLTPSEKDLKCVQIMESSADGRNFLGLGRDSPKYLDGKHSDCSKEREIIHSLSLDSSHASKSAEDGSVPRKEIDAGAKISLDTSQMIETLDTKDAHRETLGLLRWLAFSEAADDINSDDELVRETILSPLLPATTIEKVLEKASMDYESESQKECQDILDSVDDLINFERLQEKSCPSNHSHSSNPSSDKMIPQVDGAGDDLLLTPCAGSAGNSSERELKSKVDWTSEHNSSEDAGTSFNHKRKREKLLWGSLPFSAQKSMNDREPVSFCSDTKKLDGISSLSEKEAGKHEDASMKDAEDDVCDLKDTTTLIGCSVRDLMRRKRFYRLEPVKYGSQGVRNVSLDREQKEDVNICPRHLDFQMSHIDRRQHESLNDGLSLTDQQSVLNEVFDVKTTDAGCPLYGKFAFLSNSDNSLDASALDDGNFNSHISNNDDGLGEITQSRNSSVAGPSHGQVRSRISKAKNLGSAALIGCYETYSRKESDVTMLKSNADNNLSTRERLQQIDAAASSCLKSAVEYEVSGQDGDVKSNLEGQSSRECIHEMYIEKPVGSGTNSRTDMIFLNDGQNHGEPSMISDTDKDLITMTFYKEPPVADWMDRTSEKFSCCPIISCLPFFSDKEYHDGTSGGSFQEETEIQNKCMRASDSSSHQEAVIGVPTHCQNDGSFSYLLTPVISPPSAENVKRWLSSGEKGTSVEDNIALSEPSSQKGSSSSLIGSQSSLLDDGERSSPESDSVVHVRPIMEQGSQDNCEKVGAVINPFCNEMTTVVQGEGDDAKIKACSDCTPEISQISGPDGRTKPTPLSQIGFRDPASVGDGQQLTLLSIEVQADSRGDLQSDPRFDAINIIALAIQNDSDSAIEVYVLLHSKSEICQRSPDGISGCNVLSFYEEKFLLDQFKKIVCTVDPDILMGWDIQGGSLGFLAERASHLGIGLLNNISRTPSETKMPAGDSDLPEKGILDNIVPESVIADSVGLESAIIEDEWGRTHASGVHVGGRIVLNVWRLMRGEIKLNMYTVEAVAHAVLRRKIPYIHYKVLTRWFSSGPGQARYRCIEYIRDRATLNLEIMNQLDMINRTSELARVFGIDFFSVLSRGSQYRVESMYLRLAHTQNYLAVSPGHQQVASQPAMECLPLVMEPESGFYADPVVVLDFQSLYPSMIIAYNLCYSTCLGKVVPSKANTLGVSSYSPDPRVLLDLKDQILLTPNAVMYVPTKIRKGILPRLLEEILATRIMVKQAMKKLSPSQQVLHKIFNARQLALKLIANVTYGYTAAGFSGRMPCAELADSIVQCARSTLEKAISYVNAQEKWKARVIYGDTDSMFVLLKGRNVADAFRIGHEIASEITAMNPNPVVLKMEKVYHPCFLLTKKRYVGYSYENPKQSEPVFDAKGIETVRRDTCAAVAKTLEQSLRLFFEHQDISEVKQYLQRQWKRILSGRVSLQDFVFAKEVRLGTYSTRVSSALPPAAIVATKAMRNDPRAEPCYGERVPYVVIHGEPGARLVDMVVDPLDLLAFGSPYRLNDIYYINKQIIPALQRVFGLVGADLGKWFSEMPRPAREAFAKRPFYDTNPHRTRIDYYYLSKHCIVCGELVQASAHLCNECSQNRSAAATAIIGRTSKLERDMQHLSAICRHCGGGDWVLESGVKCTSLACSVFYERCKVQKELRGLASVASQTGFYPKCMVEWF